MDESRERDPLLDALRQRAGEGGNGSGAAADSEGAVPDLVDALRATKQATGETGDLTLAGYIHEHDRPPAFEGPDGQPYTVGIVTEETGEPERPWIAYLLFPRWAATGAGIMGHVESGDVGTGRSEEEVRSAAGDLTLFEVKEELDRAVRAIDRRG